MPRIRGKSPVKKPVATSILRPFTFCLCRQASRQNGGASKSGRFRLFPRRFACRRNTPSAPARHIRRDFVRTIISYQTSAVLISSNFAAPLGRFCGIITLFRECGAMVQRGEIQCADNQFALQSSRLLKPENFQIGDTMQRKCKSTSSLRIPIWASQGLRRNTNERIYLLQIRVCPPSSDAK